MSSRAFFFLLITTSVNFCCILLSQSLSTIETSTICPFPKNENPASRQRQVSLQTYVISLERSKFERFENSNSGVNGSTWFPALNGYDQVVLNQYASITGFRSLNATKFSIKDNKRKIGYEHPHHIGCFMSHWNLLKLLSVQWKTLQVRPDMVFVFEDDATCIDDVINRSIEIVARLPQDWDILYIGGKPFTYYDLDPLPSSWRHLRDIQKDLSRKEFRHLACEGVFGRTSTGPFAPNGSRELSLEQPYWGTRYITNTHAYVINPRHIDRILATLDQSTRKHSVPVDIAFADAFRAGALRAYMSTQEFCIQGEWRKDKTKPEAWRGLYYGGPGLDGHRIDAIYFSECPNKV